MIFEFAILVTLLLFAECQMLQETEKPQIQEWKNCNSSTSVVFKKLEIRPNPIQFGHTLTISVDVLVKEQLGQGLSGHVELKIKQGASYVDICDIIGPKTCQLPDVCGALHKFASKCPESLKKQHINCTCPIPKNEYKLSNLEFSIPDIHFSIAGSFEAIVHIIQDGSEVVCLDLKFCLVQC